MNILEVERVDILIPQLQIHRSLTILLIYPCFSCISELDHGRCVFERTINVPPLLLQLIFLKGLGEGITFHFELSLDGRSRSLVGLSSVQIRQLSNKLLPSFPT